MHPKNGYEDWEVTAKLSTALGYPMNYKHASEIMDEIARLTPTFHGVSFKKLDEMGQPFSGHAMTSIQPVRRLCILVSSCVAKVSSLLRNMCRLPEKVNAKFPLILTTGRILSQYNVGAQTRRTLQMSGQRNASLPGLIPWTNRPNGRRSSGAPRDSAALVKLQEGTSRQMGAKVHRARGDMAGV